MTLSYRFNQQAFRSIVEHLQERQRGDAVSVILAAIDRKTRPVLAKTGQLEGQQVQLVTIRPIVSAGWDSMASRKVYTITSLNQSVLAANEWLSWTWIEDIVRRTKAVLPNGFPYQVRRFLLEGNCYDSDLATPRVFLWLSTLYGRLSLEQGDAAARESARLAALADGMNRQMSERADIMEMEGVMA